MAVKFTNNAKTTLASGITNSATTATVVDGSVFPSLGAGEYFYITFDDASNNEIVKVTARSSNTLTIVRAQDNTSARAFATGNAAELRVIAALLTEIQENIAAKSANQTVYSATTASNATAYNVGIDPGVEANASVFLDGVYQNHDTFSFSGSTLTFDAAPTNGTKLEVVVDNLVNLQSSNLTVDTFTASSNQTAFTLSDSPAAEENLLVFINGVFQDQATYTISTNVLTVDAAVTNGHIVTIYTINPVNIGTPSDSTVTSAKLTGNITLPGSLTVGAYDVAFDSPTFVVDNANSRVGIGTASPATGALDVVGEVHISSHLDMPDDAIIKLGTGDDLQFYHDASHSYIINTYASGALKLKSNDFRIENTASRNQLKTGVSGAVQLFYDTGSATSVKLATASTGIDVTGNITVSGTVDGVDIAARDAILTSTTTTAGAALPKAGGTMTGALVLGGALTVGVDGTGYDVKFFGDTSGAYMLWDESADDLKLVGAAGLTVAGDIDVAGTTNLDILDIDGAVDMASTLTVAGATNDGTTLAQITQSGTGRGLAVNRNVASATRAMVNLAQLHASGGAEAVLDIQQTTPASRAIKVTPDGGTDRFSVYGTGALVTTPAAGGHAVFNEAGLDADFRVESSGNANMLFVDGGADAVGIGTASPAAELHVSKSADAGNAEIILENSFTNTGSSTDETTQIQGRFGGYDGSYIITGKEDDYTTAALRKSYLAFSTRTATTGMTEKFRIDSSGNVGIGVTPESWHTSYTALQFAGNGALSGWGNQQAGAAIFLSQNSYLDPTNWKYISTDEASRYEQVNGAHTFSVAPSGTADAAISWTNALTIDNSGAVDVGGRVSHSTITTLSSDGTPSVSAGNYFVTGDTTTITDFDDGVVGQTIHILAEHAKTITDNAAIILDGSANFVMAVADTLTLTMFNDQVWQETGRTTNVATTSGTSVGILMFYGAQ